MMAAAFLLEQKADDAATVRDVALQLRRATEELARQTRLISAMLRPARTTSDDVRPSPDDGPVAERAAQTPGAVAAASPGPIRVVLADDQANDRSLLADVLRTLGHDVVAVARSGDEAVALAGSTAPDVVLLDIRMPGGTGIEAAQRLRTTTPDVAIVLYTGDPTLNLRGVDLEESGALAVLPKPAAPNAIDASLRLAVRRAAELRLAQAEAADAKLRLEQRKVIERAKGMLMQRMQVSEAEAYRFLQKTSQNRAVPIVELAKLILENDGVVR